MTLIWIDWVLVFTKDCESVQYMFHLLLNAFPFYSKMLYIKKTIQLHGNKSSFTFPSNSNETFFYLTT